METPLYFLTRAEAEAKLGTRIRLRVPIIGLRVGMIGRVIGVRQRTDIPPGLASDCQETYDVVVSWEAYETSFGKGFYAHALEELEEGRA
jgi:hypothetical protein